MPAVSTAADWTCWCSVDLTFCRHQIHITAFCHHLCASLLSCTTLKCHNVPVRRDTAVTHRGVRRQLPPVCAVRLLSGSCVNRRRPEATLCLRSAYVPRHLREYSVTARSHLGGTFVLTGQASEHLRLTPPPLITASPLSVPTYLANIRYTKAFETKYLHSAKLKVTQPEDTDGFCCFTNSLKAKDSSVIQSRAKKSCWSSFKLPQKAWKTIWVIKNLFLQRWGGGTGNSSVKKCVVSNTVCLTHVGCEQMYSEHTEVKQSVAAPVSSTYRRLTVQSGFGLFSRQTPRCTW